MMYYDKVTVWDLSINALCTNYVQILQVQSQVVEVACDVVVDDADSNGQSSIHPYVRGRYEGYTAMLASSISHDRLLKL